MLRPLVGTWFQELFHSSVRSAFSEMRATVLSIRNFVIRLIFAAIAPFIGWLNDFYSLHVALLVSAGIIAIPGILFLVLQFRKAD